MAYDKMRPYLVPKLLTTLLDGLDTPCAKILHGHQTIDKSDSVARVWRFIHTCVFQNILPDWKDRRQLVQVAEGMDLEEEHPDKET